jgi:hypothetical protein
MNNDRKTIIMSAIENDSDPTKHQGGVLSSHKSYPHAPGALTNTPIQKLAVSELDKFPQKKYYF